MTDADPHLAPWPFYAEDEIEAVAAVLRSGRVNYRTGDEGLAFEAEFAAYCGTSHALTVANGTAALELALEALNIGPGDEVIVPARTFVATASAVVRCGATPIVADIDIHSQNMTVEATSAVLSERTRAIIPVHLAGWPADMDDLMSFARASGLLVIEDCAQAHGATLNGQPVGTFGDVGCFSFCQDKIISTGGEGGMVVTANTDLYKTMWSLRDHGWDYDKAHEENPAPGFRWLVERFATNWRMTESQSAIGRLQLRKLGGWVKRRRMLASHLDAAIAGNPAAVPLTPPENARHSYYRYNILLDRKALRKNWTRDRVVEELNSSGIPARVGACPDISAEQAFTNARLNTSQSRPVARDLEDRTIALPVHPTLSDGNITFIAETLRRTLNAASSDAA